MTTPKIKLTEQGLLNLKNKISDLHERLSAVTKGKSEAFEYGGNGWHENSAFEDMVERERVLSQELKEMNDLLDSADAIVIMPSDVTDIGATVTVVHSDQQKTTYIITDPFCVDLGQRRISYDSPIGRALIGKRVGDEIQVKPNDTMGSRIESIVYAIEPKA